MAALTLTDLSRRTGVSPRALRFYEARGLLAPLRLNNGRRLYAQADAARLLQILALKRAGFSLDRIAALLRQTPDNLAGVIGAQRDQLRQERDQLDQALAALTAALGELNRGTALSLDTLCRLIREGDRRMTQAAWQSVYDRYYTPEQQAEWRAAKQAMADGLDLDAYNAKWKELTDRIEAALPLDAGSAQSAAFLAEWRVLQQPMNDTLGPLIQRDPIRLFDRMAEWQDMVSPPFSAAVWAWAKAASAAQPVSG
ncbi:MerR family transcriptional regulator [Sandaracinobacteroides saxicola]|uniref:MerR family transcriptional regulator n=1 Tax=Sandaracinobacteroides saxicola TaxID=2759707 RepID=A0A7G5IHS0_9SPHN|nr:MerR family transcriptional regulator [Sandaracinobacteroides saxicola]QMW22912.1 MerR family transcriptional regulator [Sandaracinobacteroides saxicola]